MRGYFGIGVESISKPMNIGNLLRTAHSFDASFFFTVNTDVDVRAMRSSDTSGAFDHLPFYDFATPADIILPRRTEMVAIEFVPDAINLPSFRHPKQAVYVLGPEMGNVSPEMLKRCDHVIKIPMKFCVNVGVAGALVMYDRLISFGRFADRPVKSGGPNDFDLEGVKDQNVVSHGHRRFTRSDK